MKDGRLRRLGPWLLPVALLGALVTPSSRLDAQRSPSLRYQLLAADSVRSLERTDLVALFRSGLADADPHNARLAARALGHLERAEFIDDLAKTLAHADAGVREEAANALGYVAAGAADRVFQLLRDRLADEKDAGVRGTLLRTIGRLPFKTVEERRTAEALEVEEVIRPAISIDTRLGAIRGIESLVRPARGTSFKAADGTIQALQAAVLAVAEPGAPEDAARIRRVALTALTAAGRIDATHERAMHDPDAQVRRLAVAGVVNAPGDAGAALRANLVAAGLADRDPMVRYEALRVHGRSQAAKDCGAQLAALGDGSLHVRLQAIDQLATVCPSDERATAALESLVFGKSAGSEPGAKRLVFGGSVTDWRQAAHALGALVRRTPQDNGWPARLLTLAAHGNWHVREYAARAAEFVTSQTGINDAGSAAAPVLERFAADANANVREAAIGALSRVRGHAADAIYINALARPDYQVVIAACGALKGTTERASASRMLLKALRVITDQHKDTSLDARVAILERLKETAAAPDAAEIRRYVTTYGLPAAKKAAEIVTALTGETQTPSDVRLSISGVGFPLEETLNSLPARLRVRMASGGSFDIDLYLEDTPLSAWRVTQLVQSGYYNGLTFHRIVPNFVVQGGSPGANEVVGATLFMKDEPGLRSNNRGTVGISTRGRDTGDGQIYINLVDSPRLDHTYYVIGEVVRGMDVVDRIGEGDVILSIESMARR